MTLREWLNDCLSVNSIWVHDKLPSRIRVKDASCNGEEHLRVFLDCGGNRMLLAVQPKAGDPMALTDYAMQSTDLDVYANFDGGA